MEYAMCLQGYLHTLNVPIFLLFFPYFTTIIFLCELENLFLQNDSGKCPVVFLGKIFVFLFVLFCLKIFYIHERHRESSRDTGEGEAGSMQGARCGTPSWDSRIKPWAEGRCSTAEPPRDPMECFRLRISPHAI